MGLIRLCTALAIAAAAASLPAQEPAMVRGIGWRTDAIFTVGARVGSFQPTGKPDGIGAFPGPAGSVHVLVNSELDPGDGYAYKLANGTELTGARVITFDVKRVKRRGVVSAARLSYDRIMDRAGKVVTDPKQVNESGKAKDGLARLCSAYTVEAGQLGFADDVFLTGEELAYPKHPHGGSIWVLDVKARDLWAAPALGRSPWENACPFDTGDKKTVGLLLGADAEAAPLFLYVGTKGTGTFLDRNGLARGRLFAWVADNGDTTPKQFRGRGAKRPGKFVEVAVRDASKAGKPGYDAAGYLDGPTLRAKAKALGAFLFSRPEDLHLNPANAKQLVFASTGSGATYWEDEWGAVYAIDMKVTGSGFGADLTILHDADGLRVPDRGIRNPDNLVWAADGMIYVQEDRSTLKFGKVSGIDASIWQLDPKTGNTTRIGEVNRTVVLPLGSKDQDRGELGAWETSGIVDVTALFPTEKGETLLLSAVQPHGIVDGPIGGKTKLAVGGQLLFLSNRGLDHSVRCRPAGTGVEVVVDVTNGAPLANYALVVAITHAGRAPNGSFHGVEVTQAEWGLLVAPLLGALDKDGCRQFSFRLPGTCPLGVKADAVALQLDAMGTPVRVGPATRHDF